MHIENYLEEFERDGSVRWIEPMSSHEINIYHSEIPDNYFAEEKFDGHRGIIQVGHRGVRVFSRTISKKTKWFTENTGNVPHITRAFSTRYQGGTILDGEFVQSSYGANSNNVQRVMGSLPERAKEIQEKEGYLEYVAFDILYYRGVNVQNLPLYQRKALLLEILDEVNCGSIRYAEMKFDNKTFDRFYKQVAEWGGEMLADEMTKYIELMDYTYFFEGILANDGEGIMLKDMYGVYEQKRSKLILKVKGVSTWDCVVMGFTEPTRIYDGKELDKWRYWSDSSFKCEREALYINENPNPVKLQSIGHVPVTKPYFMGWCGAIQFGVWKEFVNVGFEESVLNQMYDEGNLRDFGGKTYILMHVGDCKGLTEKELENIKNNGDDLIGKVVEVKANGILDITKGSLRHPRFVKFRSDKENEMCTFENHLSNLGGN